MHTWRTSREPVKKQAGRETLSPDSGSCWYHLGMLGVRSAALRSIIGWALCCLAVILLPPRATGQYQRVFDAIESGQFQGLTVSPYIFVGYVSGFGDYCVEELPANFEVVSWVTQETRSDAFGSSSREIAGSERWARMDPRFKPQFQKQIEGLVTSGKLNQDVLLRVRGLVESKGCGAYTKRFGENLLRLANGEPSVQARPLEGPRPRTIGDVIRNSPDGAKFAEELGIGASQDVVDYAAVIGNWRTQRGKLESRDYTTKSESENWAVHAHRYTLLEGLGEVVPGEFPTGDGEKNLEIHSTPILRCRYPGGHGIAQRGPYFYWYREKPAALTPEVESSLAVAHPLNLVGEVRDACPPVLPPHSPFPFTRSQLDLPEE